MIASEGGHKQVVQTLVSAGGNVNIQDNKGWTCGIDYSMSKQLLCNCQYPPPGRY